MEARRADARGLGRPPRDRRPPRRHALHGGEHVPVRRHRAALARHGQDVGARGGHRAARGVRPEAREDVARAAGARAGRALARGGARARCLRSTDGGKTFASVASLTQHETRDRWEPGAGGMCCHSIQLDADDPRPDVRRDLRRGIVPHGRRRRDVDADQQERRRRLPPREVPGGRPVRPQAARAPGEDRAALAAEPLRRLPLRRPRATTGSGWTATACPAASASRS